MKQVFEGIVNGVKYDTVEDYNKAVKIAMDAGNCEASTRTYTVNEIPETSCNCLCDRDCPGHRTPFVTVSYDEDGEVEDVKLDYYEACKDSDLDYEEQEAFLNASLEHALREKVIPYVKSLDCKEGYLDDLEHINKKLADEANELQKEIHNLESKLDEAEANLQLTKAMQAFYASLQDGVEDGKVEEPKTSNLEDLRERAEQAAKELEDAIQELVGTRGCDCEDKRGCDGCEFKGCQEEKTFDTILDMFHRIFK